ncbi:MAG: hypothetical protein U0R17_02560 [Acidimicrobiia bacterium]
MSKSHGMGPDEYARYLFDQEFARRTPKEKRDFLISTIDDFANKAQYSSHRNPVSLLEANTAIYAAELFLGVTINLGQTLSDTDKYRITKLIELLDGLRFDDGEISTKKLNELNSQLSKPQEQKIAEPQHHQNPEGKSKPNTPREKVELDQAIVKITLKDTPNLPNSEKAYFVQILPQEEGDDPFTSDLKKLVRSRFERGVHSNPRDDINALCQQYDCVDKYDNTIRRFNTLAAKCVNELSKMIRNPSGITDDPKTAVYLRNTAVGAIGLFYENLHEGRYQSDTIVDKALSAKKFFVSDDFRKICRHECAKFLYSDKKIDRKNLRRYMTIGHVYGNSDVEFLAAVTHVTHGQNHGEPARGIDPHIRKHISPAALNKMPSWLMNVRYCRTSDTTWREVAQNTVALLHPTRDNPAR